MRSCAALVALLLVVQPASPVAVQSRDTWINGRTANFNIVSNANNAMSGASR